MTTAWPPEESDYLGVVARFGEYLAVADAARAGALAPADGTTVRNLPWDRYLVVEAAADPERVTEEPVEAVPVFRSYRVAGADPHAGPLRLDVKVPAQVLGALATWDEDTSAPPSGSAGQVAQLTEALAEAAREPFDHRTWVEAVRTVLRGVHPADLVPPPPGLPAAGRVLPVLGVANGVHATVFCALRPKPWWCR
ncbi:hypothetical protein GCM10010124_18590 [Pilimelia terevasa]|uniref:Uncharacterized protein n=2 Tax=Pilimelia terevasa TaxID=53372 RepID=A0A8J3FGU8_9ACTN|nr:hypothetical protein GCM10010124_18590 [Pilimelia terevasa]